MAILKTKQVNITPIPIDMAHCTGRARDVASLWRREVVAFRTYGRAAARKIRNMKLAHAALVALAGLSTFVSIAARAEPELASAGTIAYEQILAKYADPDSKFVALEGADGIRVHYKDEGTGPAVLLIHSSFGDLKDWDPWVKVLARRYRVVRLDLPAFGLTGPVPSGNYSIDRYLTLVDALMDHLGIERFAIVGTSYGGLVAFRYAATRLERVQALVLANSAGVEYGGRGGTKERVRAPATSFKPEVRTAAVTEAALKRLINDPDLAMQI